MSESIEPDFVFLRNPTYIKSVFGIFIGFTTILVLSLRGKSTGAEWFILAPLIFMIAFTFLPDEFETPINYIIQFLGFPVSFIESYYFTRLTCFCSRYLLKTLNTPSTNGKLLPPRNSLPYRIAISSISIVSFTTTLVLLMYGFEHWLLSWYHGVVFAGLVFAFLFTIVCDNGIISDPCMIALRTSLSIAPILCESAGFFTVFLRLFLVLSSLISLKFSLEDWNNANDMKGLTLFFGDKNFKKKQTSTSLLCMLITFVFLYQEAFIRPSWRICGWQAMTCPILYIFFLLVEAHQYHVA
ncbi:hypothetical protein TRFO_23568 [Tritrichomonas foetus]|uniref:Uncharacterized protein n=1 Tax=Tritrichomonas foetus TaxID=1144522 RepID=A0A1J4K9E8_9EUKA|nr:hypothetical protein TRFO_23568 [Tritrichomonas foetus]|eukprot:OHT08039.1 hypothetical protein TRFO_23568 [Tritrichomonas foetus]